MSNLNLGSLYVREVKFGKQIAVSHYFLKEQLKQQISAIKSLVTIKKILCEKEIEGAKQAFLSNHFLFKTYKYIIHS